MNIARAYKNGFTSTLQSPRMLLFIYVMNLLLSLLLALPFMKILQTGFGDSMVVNSIKEGFSFTVFTDFFQNSKSNIVILANLIKWVGLIYILFNIFINGGILRTLNKERFTITTFFTGSGYNFWRFLFLTMFMFVIHIIVALIIFIPSGIFYEQISLNASSELTSIYWWLGTVVLYLFFLVIFLIVSDYAKFYIVLNDSINIFNAFWKGLKYTFSNFIRVYVLYLWVLIIPIALTYIYIKVSDDIGMLAITGIILTFLLNQIFILLRIFFRVWLFASELELYSDDFIKDEKAKNEKARYAEWDAKVEKVNNEAKKILNKEDDKQQTTENKDTSEKTESIKEDENKKDETDADTPKDKIITEEEMLKKIENEKK